MSRSTRLVFLLAAAVLAGGGLLAHSAAGDRPTTAEIREQYADLLPDFSQGLTGRLGPFLWSRAMDIGADARFSNEQGRPQVDGEFLWLYQFMRLPREKPQPLPLLHERHNFTSIDPDLTYRLQPWHVLLHCPSPHNFKLMFGYVEQDFRFEHGDNADLAHLADTPRVIAFVPIRGNPIDNPAHADDQGRYFLSDVYAAQSISIVEFHPGEIIEYDWFRNRDNLDERILFDLAPYFGGDKRIHPGVHKPIFEFTIEEDGGWMLKIKRDGREGLDGDDDWDHIFTHESEGARPYTVDLDAGRSTFSISTFSPGGSPEESSEFLMRLEPVNRDTGEVAEWPARDRRIRTFHLDHLDRVLDGATRAPHRPR